jgi:hypothetical protein
LIVPFTFGRKIVIRAFTRKYAKKSNASPIELDPVAIDRFSRLMRDQLTSGDWLQEGLPVERGRCADRF